MRWRVKVANGQNRIQRGRGRKREVLAEIKIVTKHQGNSREKRNN
jgi:hypothetical protein